MATVEWAGLSAGGPGADRAKALDWALRYLDMGWAIQDGWGIAWGECGCGRPSCGHDGKQARGGWGKGSRKTLTRQEALWTWSEKRIKGDIICPNLFLICHLSDIVVIDVDDMQAWARVLEDGTLDVPPTLMAQSGSGKLHMIYRREWNHDGDVPRLRKSLPGNAGDVKFNGYIAVAPSSHKSGGVYEWLNWGAEIAEAPAWLGAERAVARETPLRIPRNAGLSDNVINIWTDAMRSTWMTDLAGFARRYEEFPEGSRNRPDIGYAIAFRGGHLVAMGVMEQEEVERLLYGAAVRNQWVEDAGEMDVRRQITNGVRDGVMTAESESESESESEATQGE